MTLETLVQTVKALTVEERKQLVIAILDSFTEEKSMQRHQIREFRGVGAHLRDLDAQEHVNELRREWDDHP